MRCRYNAVDFLNKYSQKTPYSSPVWARYGVSFVDTASEWYSAWFSAIIYIISYYIGARYNGTWLYLRSVVVGNWLIDYIIYAQPTTKVYVWLSLLWFVILRWMQWKLTIILARDFWCLCVLTPRIFSLDLVPHGDSFAASDSANWSSTLNKPQWDSHAKL